MASSQDIMRKTEFSSSAAAGLVLALVALAGCVASEDKAPSGLPADPGPVTPPAQVLQEDTVEALRHDRRQSGLPYVGVWAADAAGCRKMDQTTYDLFAVITPTTVRQFEESCTYERQSAQGGTFSFAASCEAEGAKSERTIGITMVNDKSLLLQNIPTRPGTTMIRCRLQE
jgi:hypothetical protein